MAANYVRIEIENGVNTFYCPVCSVSILDGENGLSESLCKHCSLTIDWVDQIQISDHVSDELTQQIENAFCEEGDEEAIARLSKALPASSVLFELIEPPRGGGHSGSTFTVCIDFCGGGCPELEA